MALICSNRFGGRHNILTTRLNLMMWSLGTFRSVCSIMINQSRPLPTIRVSLAENKAGRASAVGMFPVWESLKKVMGIGISTMTNLHNK